MAGSCRRRCSAHALSLPLLQLNNVFFGILFFVSREGGTVTGSPVRTNLITGLSQFQFDIGALGWMELGTGGSLLPYPDIALILITEAATFSPITTDHYEFA